MSSVKNQDSNSILLGPPNQSTQIVLIDAESQRMRLLHEVLKVRGYPTRLFYNTDEALAHLSNSDILLLDATVATQTKASGFIGVVPHLP